MRSKRVITNIVTSLILQIVTIICGFLIPKLIITTYGSKVNGLVTSISQFLAYITLLEAGFAPVIKSILFKPIADKNKSEIEKILSASERIFRKISYVLVAYIAILCIALPITLRNEFDTWFTVSLIIIISISTFAEYYFGMTYRIFLQAKQLTYVVAIIQLVTYVANIILIIGLMHFKASIQAVKLATTCTFALRPILQNMYVKKKLKIDVRNADEKYNIKQKWDGLAQHIAFVIHQNADIVILTLSGNILDISVYSIYSLIILNVTKVIEAFNSGIDATFGDMIAKGEKEKLNKSFKIYEGVYLTIATIVFSSSLLLIIPFTEVYTNGISDANYVRPDFAYIFVTAEFIYVIKQVYYNLVKIAGRFKQTKKGAYIEATTNIIVSIALVYKYGMVGVAIGTLVAMTIRTTEIIYYTSKHILNRSIMYVAKRIMIVVLEAITIVIVLNIIPTIKITGYMNWTLQAIIVIGISSIVVIPTNCLIFKDNVKIAIEKIKTILSKKSLQK